MPMLRRFATAALALTIASLSLAADRTPPSVEKGQAGLFTLVNATFDSVTALALADAHSDAFEDVALGESLPGGLASATVRLPAGACVRDVRVTFRDGRTQVFPAIDVCRSHMMRLSTQSGARGGQ